MILWFRSLSLPAKVMVVLVGVVLYVASAVATTVGLYCLKWWLDIDVSKAGGWHRFSACLNREESTFNREIQHKL